MREMENPAAFVGLEKKKIKIAILDNSHQVENAARDAADKKMNRSKEDLNGIKGILERVWKHNLAKSYYQKKEAGIAKRKIVKEGNVFANEDGTNDDHEKEKMATIERFLMESDGTVREQAGEIREVLSHEKNDLDFRNKLKKLIVDYASSKIDEDIFREERSRIINDLSVEKRDVLGKGLMYSDNILESAKELKQAFDHGERMEDLDIDLEVIIGKSKAGVRTEAQYDAVDRFTEKVMSSKIGSLVNETTVASALSIAYSIGAAGSRSLANNKLAAMMSFGATALLGGGIAAARERKMMEDDRRQHFREMAQGKKFDETKNSRRKELDEFHYDTRDSAMLASELDNALYTHGEDGKCELRQDLSSLELQAAFGHLAEIESRISVSDIKKIDLISFSDVKKVEQERLELDVARAKAKNDLRKYEDSSEMKKLLGGKNVDEFLASLTETRSRQLIDGDKGIEKKNNLFNACKNKHTAKAFVKGVATGLVVGAAAQELMAFVNSEQVGLAENLLQREASGAVDANGVEHYTPLEFARRWAMDKFTGAEFPRMDMRNGHEVLIGATHVKLPEGIDLIPDGNGTYSLMQNGTEINSGISFDANGNITPDSQRMLIGNDINIKQAVGAGSAKDFIANNPDVTTHIKRDLWYENNTEKPIFEKNELKLWWGGKNGTGIDSNGNYVFNIKNMASDGSYQGKFSVDAQDAMKEGKLKMVFSLSGDTQSHVIECPIDADGNAIIDPESETGKMLFKNVDGHAKFVGRFAEVVEDMGNDEKGVDHVRVLATHIGKGVENVTTPVAIFDMPAPYVVDSQWIIPAVGRTPLEPDDNRKFTDKTKEYYYSYGNEGYGLLSRDKYRARMSRSIIENKDLDVSKNDSAIIAEYFGKQDSAYLDELNEIVSEAESMKKGIKVSITIPSYQEGKNMEKTLRNYAKLKGRDKFELVILENHPKDKERDNTVDVIAKIKDEFPDVNLIHLYKVFDEKPAIGEVRKYLVDAVLLRKQNAGIKESIAIVSNDADLEDISENYALQVEKTFSDRKVDAMGGKWDFPSETFKKLPLLHAIQRLWHYLDIAFRNYYLKSPELIGRNSAFRSGIYAAVGGYNETSQLAEDLEIGWLIKDARRYDTDRIVYNNAASLVSNPRRAVNKILSGGRLIQQYGDFHVNEDVRNTPIEKLLENKIDFTEEQLKAEIQSIYDHYSNWKKSKGGWIEDFYVNKSFDKAMSFLGVKYLIDNNDKIDIVDILKLNSGLDKYSN